MSRKSKTERVQPESPEEMSTESEEEQSATAVTEMKGSEAEDEASADSDSDKKIVKKSKKRNKVESGGLKQEEIIYQSGDKSGEKKKKKRRNPLDAQHPPTTEMVLDALLELDEKKGSTIAAIKNFITTENTVRPEQLSHLMRAALPKLIAKEKIIRPKGEENKSVMMGRYKIAPLPQKQDAAAVRSGSLRTLRNSSPIKKKKKKRRNW